MPPPETNTTEAQAKEPEPTTPALPDPFNTDGSDEGRERLEADADTALDSILDGSGVPPDDPADVAPAPGRDEHGRFASKTKTPPGEPEPKAEDSEPAPQTDTEPEGYQDALKALRRDKVPEKAYQNLSPEEITAWGLERAQDRSASDGFGNRIKELEGTATGEDGSQPADDQIKVDLGNAVEHLADYFGDEVREPMQQLGDQIMKQVSEQANARLGEIQGAFSQLQHVVQGMQVEAVRGRLSGQFPQLATEEGLKAAEAASAKLDQSNFKTLDEYIAAASELAFGKQTLANAQRKRLEMDSAKSVGQPFTVSQASAAPGPPSPDEDDAILDGILTAASR